MKKYLIIAVVALAALSVWLGYLLIEKDSEYSRLQHNQEALLQEVQMYKTQEGKSAASVLGLQLSYNELERHYKEKCLQAEELGVKVKRLQSMTTTGTETHLEASVPIRDSIVYSMRDSIVYVDTLKWFAWRDPPWVEVRGSIGNGVVDVRVQSNDTLIQLVPRVPTRFLFFKFGTKAIRQELVSMNPHTAVKYAEYIEVTK